MKFLKYLLAIPLVLPTLLSAQMVVKGTVNGTFNGKKEPVPGAGVGWIGTKITALTTSDGSFEIVRPQGAFELYAFSYGFLGDTIRVPLSQQNVVFNLLPSNEKLNEVVVRDNQSATSILSRDVKYTEFITQRELTKAACCNLSESFETNPAIDASFTDAVTGTRQIRLLGLDGPYTTFTRGNVPVLGGLATVLGLQLIPGSWIESIQLTKGSGSVMNGYESMVGQVNYELRSAASKEKAYVQLYANNGGRFEQSATVSHKFSKKLSTTLMLYGRQQALNMDFNDDGFVDNPQGNMWIVHNTWDLATIKGWESQSGVKFATSDLTGGQISAMANDSIWKAKLKTNRFEFWNKTGYVFKNAPSRSFGLQLAYNYQEQNSDFGMPNAKTYSGLENNFYMNFIFQDIIVNTNHQYKAGFSYKNVAIDETYLNQFYLRREQVPGVFAEYSYLPNDKTSIVGGIRADNHNLYGLFFTPRLHIRYAPKLHHTFRFNIGKAYRTPNLFADNVGVMASNRVWNIQTEDNNLPYFGLKQEESINTGVSYTHDFDLDYRPGIIRAEYFYTAFQNQLVKDWYQEARTMYFYNLEGRSFAHSAQIQLDYEVIQRLELRLAYRYVDAKTAYKNLGLIEQPFVAKHRTFANIAYETRKAWKFDGTLNYLGKQKLPSTATNQPENQRPDYSKPFATVNFQLSKTFREKLEAHIGIENAFDYKQDMPIVSANNPFSPDFDAAMIYGPVMGRMIYVGIRLKVF